MKKRKIIFLDNSGGFAGAESVNLQIICSLREKYDFYWASCEGAINEYLEERNIPHIALKKICVSEIHRIIREYQPDLFHATDYKASVVCALAGMKVPYISHLHNNSLWIKHFLHPNSIAYVIGGWKAKKILTVSDSIEREYIYSFLLHSKIENIGNPVSRDRILEFVPENIEKTYDICFVGRLTDQKKPFEFIQIIHSMKQDIPNLKAVMVGFGELAAKCAAMIQELGLENTVTMTGFQKNPYIYMAKSKIFCLPSRYEGYGLVTFEALTLGLPCFVTPVGGMVNIVTNECGHFCKNKTEFCKEMKYVLQNEQVYSRKSQMAQKRAEELDNIQVYMKKMDSIYHTVLEKEE